MNDGKRNSFKLTPLGSSSQNNISKVSPSDEDQIVSQNTKPIHLRSPFLSDEYYLKNNPNTMTASNTSAMTSPPSPPPPPSPPNTNTMTSLKTTLKSTMNTTKNNMKQTIKTMNKTLQTLKTMSIPNMKDMNETDLDRTSSNGVERKKSKKDVFFKFKIHGVEANDQLEDSIYQQHKIHSLGVFHHVKTNDVLGLEECLNHNPSIIMERDPVGATPLHVAFLYKNYDVGQYLIENHPERALDIYDESAHGLSDYKGENVLHIVIVQRNLTMAKWLLKRVPELLNAETTGKFFSPGKHCYFGGYPFLFAVATNQKELVQLILKYAKSNPKQHSFKNKVSLEQENLECIPNCEQVEEPSNVQENTSKLFIDNLISKIGVTKKKNDPCSRLF